MCMYYFFSTGYFDWVWYGSLLTFYHGLLGLGRHFSDASLSSTTRLMTANCELFNSESEFERCIAPSATRHFKQCSREVLTEDSKASPAVHLRVSNDLITVRCTVELLKAFLLLRTSLQPNSSEFLSSQTLCLEFCSLFFHQTHCTLQQMCTILATTELELQMKFDMES